MRLTAASLAVALPLLALAPGCGNGDAEPDAPGSGRALTLVLDFQPNAVHAGIYEAVADGARIDVREPGSSSDAPKLLEAGRTDLAIMDINDVGIAREAGAGIVAVGAIVQRPLAAVIAADREAVRSPADLDGRRVGVTGLPSDDAVLDTVLEGGGVGPRAVERLTIGFEAVPLLAAGRVDAATAFWNAEGVALREQGVPTREFRVDALGAPAYPELVLVASEELLTAEPEAVSGAVDALRRGYASVLRDPEAAVATLTEAVPGLDTGSQRAQLDALLAADAFTPPLELDPARIEAWNRWAAEGGVLRRPLDVASAFSPG